MAASLYSANRRLHAALERGRSPLLSWSPWLALGAPTLSIFASKGYIFKSVLIQLQGN